MKILQHTLPVLLALCSGAVHAQLYKWVGPDGKVTYSDTPPPSSTVETRPLPAATGAASLAELPFELAQAARSHPVTLYTTANCAPCDAGRALLNERGIPFRERTVSSNEDVNAMRAAGGDNNLPLLTVGRRSERGYEPNAWNAALSAAGYPASSRLPRSYRNPPPQAAAPRAEAAAPSRDATPPAAPGREATAPASALPPATGNAPPGFRF